jgi:hypothetical protein
MNELHLLLAVFTDDCTYTSEVFCGVFRSEELAKASKKDWVRAHKEEPNNWIVRKIRVDEVD